MIVLGVRTSMDCAHYIKDYEGKCSQLHGHGYIVEVTVSGELDSKNMVMDATVLKNLVKNVLETYDHKVINDVLKVDNATCEILAINIYYKLLELLPKNIKLQKVKVYETQDIWIEYYET
jgi:6-pyruvoyltetrahydropterin/6-carboxytetrahydropterin synthase